jgi:hypothetical protein
MDRCFYKENGKCYSEPCKRNKDGTSEKDCVCPCNKYKGNSVTIRRSLNNPVIMQNLLENILEERHKQANRKVEER